MGGKGGGGGGATVVQFAPYIEDAHKALLGDGSVLPLMTVVQALNAAWGNNPYDGASTISAELGYLGNGKTLANFPALFDTFTSFMSGQDLKVLWTQLYEASISGTEVDDAVAAQGVLIQDEIDERIMPKFLAGSRDLNIINSSAFVIGKALIADSKVKMVANFASTLKLKQIDIAQARWEKHLSWNTAVVTTYSDLMKLYYTVRFDSESRQLEYDVKDAMWDLSLFEYGRSMLGALNGAAAASPRNEPSQAAKGIAGAMAGAGAGAMIGKSIGGENSTAIGAGAGGVLGFAASFL